MLIHSLELSWYVLPDWNDVREEHHKTEQVPEPGSDKALKCNHNNGQHHLGQEESLGEAVELQVQQSHLRKHNYFLNHL